MFNNSSHLDYTIKLAKSLNGVSLIAWRKPKEKYRYWGQSYVPYHLANFLMLVPDGNLGNFTNKLYDFPHTELDTLQCDDIVRSVKRNRAGNIATVKIKGDYR